ncbi:hypothetical protein AAY72_12720 [Alishewanella sp. WH16-1]|uniref:hypothetical protein n=1 Tax=Alishewanella sp. WH16-1 TaxID=1651088 RepID=UPI00070AAAE1|nr:hypothetical protein [Alishewanella sp. WH16-1]KRS20604.1 hypothetical protein AAY72_12720 [Alishewanella sp. WH16-1]OYW94424.1 MAG: hypothetical protein B7Z18_05030 [Alishewanella sp. 32-51-5]
MNAAAEKISLEHEAARIFMRHYEQRFGVKMRHIWHNEPRRPDVSCYYDNQRLDLEIAHLYGSEAEAMHILGRELSQQTHQELLALLRLPVEQRMLEALNRIICNKAQKYYESEKVWLVIRNANPLWRREDMLAHCNKLHLPQQHPFEQIWVVGDMLGVSGILPLYPRALLQAEAQRC